MTRVVLIFGENNEESVTKVKKDQAKREQGGEKGETFEKKMLIDQNCLK